MQKKEMSNILWLSRYHPIANVILYYLALNQNQDNEISCEVKTIMEALQYSRNSVAKNMKVLLDNGFIFGNGNIYKINKEIEKDLLI